MTTVPTYVFRGTTIGFAGGTASRQYGYTYTSAHPGKATLFALECRGQYVNEAVVYIAEAKALDHLNTTQNALARQEDEIIFGLSPEAFFELSLGYISLPKMQEVLNAARHPVYEVARLENLTRLCEELETMSETEIKNLVETLRPHLKK